MWTYGARAEIHSVIYRINDSLARQRPLTYIEIIFPILFPFHSPQLYLFIFITDSLHTRRLPQHLKTTCPSSSHVFTASDQITLINPKCYPPFPPLHQT